MVRVRAQRKCMTSPTKTAKQCPEATFKSPKRITSPKMKGFQGKLSHASPPKIPPRSMNTRYFARFHQVYEEQTRLVSETNACQNSDPDLKITESLLETINIQILQSEELQIPSPRCSPRLETSSPSELTIITTQKAEPDSLEREIKTESRLSSEDELSPKELKTEKLLTEEMVTVKPELWPELEPESVPSFDTEVIIHESEVTNTPRRALKLKEEIKLSSKSELESVISPPLHKIQLNEGILETQSPSSALSDLQISATPTKAVKSKRRLNPSQTSNQQTGFCGTAKTPTRGMTKKDLAMSMSHKLTEYYPIVRRSVRKTKRTVLEEKQMLLEEAVKTECEDGLEVRNFEGKGRGIVATRRFFKGDFVVEYSGELIEMSEAKEREHLYTQDQNTGCYMYYFKYRNNQYCIDATKESGRMGRLVNHSRNGNLVTKTVPIGSKPHLVLIAKELIQEGEEVLYDYGDRSKESLVNHPWLNL